MIHSPNTVLPLISIPEICSHQCIQYDQNSSTLGHSRKVDLDQKIPELNLSQISHEGEAQMRDLAEIQLRDLIN